MAAELIRFQTNVREEMSFTHMDGNLTEGRYGEQYYRGTTDGRGVYLQPIVERKLLELDIKPGELVSLTKAEVKRGNKRSIEWQVRRVDPPGDPSQVSQRPTQEPRVQIEAPKPAATNGINAAEPKLSGHQQGNGTTAPGKPEAAPPKKPASQETSAQPAPITHTIIGNTLKSCLMAAIDAARDAQMYSHSHGFPLTFGPGEVQAMAVSIYIQISKQSNITQMNERYQQPRAANGGTSWPQ